MLHNLLDTAGTTRQNLNPITESEPMNKARRTAINAAIETLGDLRSRLEEIQSEMESAKDDLNACKDDEQEFHDNMPENLQSSEKGEQAEAAVDQLQNADDLLDICNVLFASIDDDIGNLLDHLQEAENNSSEAAQ